MSEETETWCHHLEKLHKLANAIKPKEWKVASVATSHEELTLSENILLHTSVSTAHGTLSRLSRHLPALEASKSVINLLVVRDGFLLHGFLHTQTSFTSHPH